MLGTTNVEKFFIKDRPYTQLSDHYGISTTLEYLESSDNDMIKKFDNKVILSDPQSTLTYCKRVKDK